MKRLTSFTLSFALLIGAFWLGRHSQNWPPSAALRTLQRVSAEAEAPEPSGQELSRYEKLLCDLANQERRKAGLKPLQIVPALADVARGHSLEMQQKNYFSHTSPTPLRRTPLDRYKLKYHRTPRLIAENIYKFESWGSYKITEADFRGAHAAWMKSPGHRANILREGEVPPTQIGVGIVVHGGSLWATQNFATPFKD